MTGSPGLIELRRANQNLSRWLAQTAAHAAIPPHNVGGLLFELVTAIQTLHSVPMNGGVKDVNWDVELDRFRRNVEELNKLLPSIHGRLLAERARIEAQRTRVKSATEWATVSRQTF